uniref:Secreted protein n=1 Tax=Streptomyces sp. NBC_00003 TaxID=2903608 RepID=A0AAU2VDC6_9ACTN
MSTRRNFITAAGTAAAATLLTGTTTANAAPETATPAGSGATAADTTTARNNILQVDTDMRANYDKLRANVLQQLGPVIVVENGMQGGHYTLVHQGQQFIEEPISQIFQLAKSIAHVPLGIFSVIAPSLDPKVPAGQGNMDARDLQLVAYAGPSNTDWITPLQTFGTDLDTARRTLEQADLPTDLKVSCAHILDAGLSFISDATRRRTFDMAGFQKFTGQIANDIKTNMYWAAKVQIEAVKDLFGRWKDKVGASAWHDLYVVVLSMWTTSELNQNSIIIKHLMDKDQVDSHLIDLVCESPSVPNAVHVALDNLARIVMDNIAAEMVFSADQQLADALKGKPDLLSQEILTLLGDTGATVNTAALNACPFHTKAKAKQAVAAA